MTTDAERDSQQQLVRELAALFAASIYPNNSTYAPASEMTIAQLCRTDDPLAFDVLQAIHAERRRRLSDKTREERRNAD